MKEQVIDDPKSQFDSIMSNAQKDNLRAKGVDPDAESSEEQEMIDEEMEAMEAEDEPIEDEDEEGEEMETQAIDKNMGTQKQVVTETTIEQHNARKAHEQQMQAVKVIRDMQGKGKNHLNEEQLKVMQLVLAKAEAGKIENPVLAHLVKQKVELSKTFVQAQVSVKELQQKMMNEIAKTADAVVKCRGAIENVDKQILDLVAEHADLID